MDIVNYISKLNANVFANRNDDDLADRLNYRYTVAILVAFAIIVSHRQFSETVIKCWVPAFFTPNYEAYANQVCWISNTYYVNQTQNVPKSEETKKSSEIKYYQWIPFILLIQALFLYIPRILWRLLSARAGLDMRDLIEAAHSYKSVEKFQNKKKIMEYIVQNIDQYTSNPRRSKHIHSFFQKLKYFGESLFCGSGIYLGNYLVTSYFFIKIVYLLNSIIQFYLMNEFLGKQFHQLGIDILRYLTNTYSIENSIESVYFPKVVMCDFRIREFGHPNFSHRYTIQCVLPINLYNQQIFTFLWFWFLLLFCANLYALAQWLNRMLPRSRRHYVNKRLNLLKYFKELNETTGVIKPKGFLIKRQKSVSEEAKRQKRKFIDDYLKFDGVFILRMISMLTSEIVGTELLHELWNKRGVYVENELEFDHEAKFMQISDTTNYDHNPGPRSPNNRNVFFSNTRFNNEPHYDAYNNTSQSYNQRGSNIGHVSDEYNKVSLNTASSVYHHNKFESIPEEKIFNTQQQQQQLKSALFVQKRNPNKQISLESSLSRTKQMRLSRAKSNSLVSENSDFEMRSRNDFILKKNTLLPKVNLLPRNSSSESTNSKNVTTPTSTTTTPKTKKVVFASSVNNNDLDEHLKDIDDVFSDIKLDTELNLKNDKNC